MVKMGRRGLVDAGSIHRRTGHHFRDEKFKPSILLFFR
jgi:hypothetical protein